MLLAVEGTSWIMIVVMVLLVLGVAYGLFTRAGSGISSTPYAGRSGVPGAESPADDPEAAADEGSATGSHAAGTDPQRGTR
jgi:hypothetical protein